jgi:hypothetical protein
MPYIARTKLGDRCSISLERMCKLSGVQTPGPVRSRSIDRARGTGSDRNSDGHVTDAKEVVLSVDPLLKSQTRVADSPVPVCQLIR